MATRTIVTSQPDVACDVCERRLLRGEQPDVFIAAGRRRIVCELCAPRAAHEGWLRESETGSLALPPLRPRRGRSLFERLRQVGKPAPQETDAEGPVEGEPDGAASYDFLGGPIQAADPVPAMLEGRPSATSSPGEVVDWSAPAAGEESAVTGAQDAAAIPHTPEESHLVEALEVFNASEYPRRVAGVARSLGTPEVSIRPAEHLSSAVQIVVAWELCWYRYEVDLSEAPAATRLLAQGTELAELPRDDRLSNALPSDSGALALAVG